MRKKAYNFFITVFIFCGSYGIAGALNDPHADYRPDAGTPTYSHACSGAACHSISPVTFLPQPLDTADAPNFEDYTNFCLACHNTAGEAHNKSVGDPSNNVYWGSTTILGDNGDSHNWNGLNHNAGTSTPTSDGFKTSKAGIVTDGTMFMPGGKVNCQTCHNSMTKTTLYNTTQNLENWAPALDQGGNRYTFGCLSTAQYLSKYIKVFRTGASITRPINTRTRNQYLVDPSEYAYNNRSAVITFYAPQGSNYIYVEIPQPYLRVDNTANAMCLDCHGDRVDERVSHALGTGAKDNHPVSIRYGFTYGLQSTVKAIPEDNIYIENGQVLCTSCHKTHNADSKDGQILREADGNTLCVDCHKVSFNSWSTVNNSVGNHNGYKHTTPTMCLDCHTTHNSNNIMLIKNVINGKRITFQNITGTSSFGNDTGDSICEACHTSTTHHRSDGTMTGHYTGKNCLNCHSHRSGFYAESPCNSCHGFPPPPPPAGWVTDPGDKHASHISYILTKFGLSGINTCSTCHGMAIRPDHNTGKLTAGIDTSSPVYWGAGTFSDGGTVGTVSTSDDTCTNVACHTYNKGLTNWGGY